MDKSKLHTMSMQLCLTILQHLTSRQKFIVLIKNLEPEKMNSDDGTYMDIWRVCTKSYTNVNYISHLILAKPQLKE